VLSTADAHGPLGRTIVYLNCEVLPLLQKIGVVNPTVQLLVALFNPPDEAECLAQGLGTATGVSKAAAVSAQTHPASGKGFTMKLLGAKHGAFGRLAATAGGAR
jgi:hypothetical protein